MSLREDRFYYERVTGFNRHTGEPLAYSMGPIRGANNFKDAIMNLLTMMQEKNTLKASRITIEQYGVLKTP